MKIAVIGFSGSGKSTLTKYLSEYFSIPLLYLDTVHFEKNWKERNKKRCAQFGIGIYEKRQLGNRR